MQLAGGCKRRDFDQLVRLVALDPPEIVCLLHAQPERGLAIRERPNCAALGGHA
jgi:hypothetical protein